MRWVRLGWVRSDEKVTGLATRLHAINPLADLECTLASLVYCRFVALLIGLVAWDLVPRERLREITIS